MLFSAENAAFYARDQDATPAFALKKAASSAAYPRLKFKPHCWVALFSAPNRSAARKNCSSETILMDILHRQAQLKQFIDSV